MDRDAAFSFRCPAASLEAFRRAADKSSLSTSEWARLVLEAAAGASELPEQLSRVVTYQPRKVRDGKW